MLAILLVSSALAAGCGEDEAAEPELRETSRPAVVACEAATVTVDFLQSEGVTVASDAGDLAFAGYARRSVSPSCDPAAAPRTRAETLGEAVQADTRLECETGGTLVITVLPVTQGDETIGSSLALHALRDGGGHLLVSAVLPDREQPELSSLEYDTDSCAPKR